jgi:hypothetical protein
VQITTISFNAAITKKSSWKNESRVLKGAFLALSLECEFLWVWELFSTEIASLLSFYNKRKLM